MDKALINSRFIDAIYAILENNISINKAYISEKLEMKPSKFSEILNRRMNIGVDTAALLCKEFNVSAQWLLNGEGTIFETNKSEIKGNEHNHDMVMYLMQKIETQAEEIGALKEKLKGLQAESWRGKDAQDATAADVG